MKDHDKLIEDELEKIKEETGITDSQVRAFINIFESIDLEKDRELSPLEIEGAMDMLDLEISVEEMKVLFRRLGKCSFDFVCYCYHVYTCIYPMSNELDSAHFCLTIEITHSFNHPHTNDIQYQHHFFFFFFHNYLILDPELKGIHVANFIRLVLMTPKYIKKVASNHASFLLHKQKSRKDVSTGRQKTFYHRMKEFLGFGLSEEDKREDAALVLQRYWRKHVAKKVAKEQMHIKASHKARMHAIAHGEDMQ